MRNDIPRVVIGAVSSGSGKTTIVTGILSALRQRGLNVQSYKIGPDYIDPGYHKLASGNPAHNLDSWLMPQEKLKEVFCRTAEDADIAIIEGVMGLYDGGRKGVSSTAEIAKLLDAPVILVIDAKSMGASAAAIALGFKMYDPEVKLAGVILNRLGSQTHKTMIENALKNIGIDVFGAVRRDDSLVMPERHLGLLPVEENEEQEIVDKIGEAVGNQVDLDEIMKLAETQFSIDIDEIEEDNENEDIPQKKIKIAVAKDDAFSFYYPESIRMLEKCGAEIVNFSPLKDKKLPKCDGVILGGGFPEMFAKELQANVSMHKSLRKAARKGKPVYAECGGFMYLTEGVVDFEGKFHEMCGIIPCKVQMNNKLQMVGYVEAKTEIDTVLGCKGTKIKGHEFHFSSEILEEMDMQGFTRAFTFTRMRNNTTYLAGLTRDNILGSYLHLHFLGCPEVAQYFVNKCIQYRRNSLKI